MTDIFIRTYKGDLDWLVYCLKSIHKYVIGYRKIIVCIPVDQIQLLRDFNLENTVVCPIYKNDYIGQQISKLLSYKTTDAEHILFVDSDVCFKKPTDISEFFKDGKPIIFKTRYELVGQAECWREPTEKILNTSVPFEYMRRLPFLFKTETLKAVDEKYNCESFFKLERLSEFNLMGAYAEINEPGNYFFWDTEKETNLPDPSLIQGWSWGGLTKEIKEQFETVLK